MQEHNASAFGPFQNLVFASVFTVLAGGLLIAGQTILLPIFIAVISVYILTATSTWLGKQPIVGSLPEWMRKALVLLLFVIAILMLTGVIISTAEQLIAALPEYQKNLKDLATMVLETMGLQVPQDWSRVWQNTVGKIDIQMLATTGLGSLSALGGVVFMVTIYAMFLMGERAGFAQKIAIAFPGKSGTQLKSIIASINRSIGDYLAIKTLINLILASISFGVLWVFGVDFALFWAIMIGLLNYIPFVGSLIGVIFPVLLTVAQFGSLQTTLLVLLLLTLAQLWVGNSLEPRMIGKKVNMSPFVVLVSLSLWTALWGIAGSILAIPLTSILAIVFSHFDATRPLAVLLAEDPVEVENRPLS